MASIDLYEDFNDYEDARAGDNDDEDNGDEPMNENAEADQSEEVNAKVKVIKVKRKLQTLNVERLKGPRGIIAVEDFFQNIKFKGKGHEKEDLNDVMNRLEHWAHRMYPKFNFDDSLTAIERLGRKKEINVHMARYRLDDLKKDDGQIHSDDEDEADRNKEDDDVPMDEFEALIDEQIALTTLHSRTNAAAQDNSFDNILSSSGISQLNHNVSSSTQISQPAFSQIIQDDVPSQQLTLSSPSVSQSHQVPSTISDEVRARIAENKRRATEIREKRIREAAETEKLKQIESEPKNMISNIVVDDDDE